MAGFTGGAGTFNNEGIVYEWSDVIVVIENDVIVNYFTQFEGGSLPNSFTDVSIDGFNVQLTQLSYRHLGGTVGVNALTIGSTAQFTQAAGDFVISGKLTNNGLMTVAATMTCTGAIENNHLMAVGTGNGYEKYMRLSPVGGDFAISGSGDMRLRDGFLTGEGGQSSVTDLLNSSKISGYGYIGAEFGWAAFPANAGYLAITNTAAGTIEADVAGRTLTIQTQLTDFNPVVNAGMMAASGGGTLAFSASGAVNGSPIFVEQTGAGTIRANNGSTVVLDNTVLTGGTLDCQGSGVIRSENFMTRLVDVDITATANVNMGRGTALEGVIENRGLMIADAFQNTTRIDADGVTLTGSGIFRLVGNYGYSVIAGEGPGAVLTNDGHTIEGKGEIVGGNLSVVNFGTIAATTDAYSLIDNDQLSLDSLAGLRNLGVLKATADSTLVLASISGGIDNADGTIRAIGANAVVRLDNVMIDGGILASSAGGVIRAGNGVVTVADVKLLAGTDLNVGRGMHFQGGIDNRGTIIAEDYYAVMDIDGDVQLSGGGTVVLRDNYGTSAIASSTPGSVLTNLNNTIRGDGYIGGANLTLINAGIIYADADPYDDFDSLYIGDLATLTNTGVLEARNGATLDLNSLISGGIQNTGGTIRASGAGSVVDLNNTMIVGGTLSAVSGGTFTMGRATWDGRASALSSDVDMNLIDAGLTLMGRIVNSGDVSFTYRSGLVLGENTTLSGGGSFTINVGYESSYFTASAPGVIFKNLGNTLGGTGSFGANSGMVLINGAAGVITANQAGGRLSVETGSVIANYGVLSANGGILDVLDNVTGSGRLEVTNGGILIVDQGTDQRVVFVGDSADTLSLSRREWSAGGFDFPVNGMGLGDRISLDIGAGVGQEAEFTFTYTAAGAVLSSSIFTDGVGDEYLIRMNGTYSFGQFQLIGGDDGAFGFVRVATRDGGSGNDVLTASKGGQRVIGLDGNDTLISRAGNDLLDGSRGSDTADFRHATSGVAVSLAITGPQAVGGGLGTDHLVSIENLVGSRHKDKLTGDVSANRLSGGAGADTMDGGSGKDDLKGGAGKDDLKGGGGNDALDGGAGSDTLKGGSGKDDLKGSAGNDALDGSAGSDTLTGGLGKDTFQFTTGFGKGNVDRITDFDVATDVIWLDDAVFSGLVGGTLKSMAFVSNQSGNAEDASDRIIYEKDTGRLFFDADGKGGMEKAQFATLDAGLTLSNVDFFVF